MAAYRQAWSGCAGVVTALLPTLAQAGDWTTTVISDPRLATVETWTGGALTGTSWALYNGVTWAPLGTLRDAGPRLRATVSAGDYKYPGIRPDGGGFIATHYHAQVLSGSVLAGYQWTTGPLTTKAFAGAATADTRTPLDPSVKDRGRETGVAVALEAWLDLGSTYLQLDTSWTALDDTLNGRARAGWLVSEAFSIGLEASAGQRTTVRFSPHLAYSGAGPFARLTWDRGEASVSGGLSDDQTNGATWYATGQVLTRY